MTLPVRSVIAGLVGGVLALGVLPRLSLAQADPTRPTFVNPMAAAAPMAMPTGTTGPAGAFVAPRPARPAAAPVPRVSSVMVSTPEFSSAVIDDRVYRLGDKVPELGTLVAIDGAGVSLRSGTTTRRLALWSRKASAPARVASTASSASSVEAKE